jgi:secretion/DNA translocation related TadE-like protein
VNGRDEGAASVWVVSLVAVLIMVLVAGAIVTDVWAARRRAEAAADLGALAAAPAAVNGDVEACRAAAWVVRENRATLESCRVVDGDVEVTTSSAARGPWRDLLDSLHGGPVVLSTTARAGMR